MKDAFERRALLLHLGDALETVRYVAGCGQDLRLVHDLIVDDEALRRFPLLGQVSTRMTAREFVRNAANAYCSWPRRLLEATLNRTALERTVHDSLFSTNSVGWHAYVAMLRKDVPWFGIDVRRIIDAEVTEENASDESATIEMPAGDMQTVSPDEPSDESDIERYQNEKSSASRESVESGRRSDSNWPWNGDI
ncbi:hypothetical protein AWB67_06860 [Caballeronia terrestris]|uniref:Uncharacterized protein n=1 Tax=Caballeronia terrestris TaxID=1226301 RepID=A0A158KVE3_9BURK|nr:hypothetical protein [Caballeronia terrestris]SAL85136.1 hypothetical protein AWB67_06860 [Caballeronia terrestris]